MARCPSLSCPLDSLPPRGASCPGISYPPALVIFTPRGASCPGRFILPLGQFAPRGASCPGISYPRPGYLHPRGASCPGRFILPPGQFAPLGASCPGISYPCPSYLHPRGASCPGWFILPPAHTKKIFLCDFYYYLQRYNNYVQFLSYKYVNLNDYFKHSVGFLIDKGWGASCPGCFILPPVQNFKENG